MDMTFPVFVRASDEAAAAAHVRIAPEIQAQQQQKSLLQLVIEAGGKLGLVPRRVSSRLPPPLPPSASAAERGSVVDEAAHFSSDEDDGDDDNEQQRQAAAAAAARMFMTRTQWLPPPHVLDYCLARSFVDGVMQLHGIRCYRHGDDHRYNNNTDSSALHGALPATPPPLLRLRDVRLPRDIEARLRSVWRMQSTYNDTHHRHHHHAAAAIVSMPPPPPSSSSTAIDQLRALVLGDVARTEDDDDDDDDDDDEVCLRGLQSCALSSLLLGEHVLLAGPCGAGKRTAAYLAMGCTLLTQAASSSSAHNNNNNNGNNDDKAVAPHALIVLPSFAALLSCGQWLHAVFGDDAFRCYVFARGDCALEPLHTLDQPHANTTAARAGVVMPCADTIDKAAAAATAAATTATLTTDATPSVGDLMRLVLAGSGGYNNNNGDTTLADPTCAHTACDGSSDHGAKTTAAAHATTTLSSSSSSRRPHDKASTTSTTDRVAATRGKRHRTRSRSSSSSHHHRHHRRRHHHDSHRDDSRSSSRHRHRHRHSRHRRRSSSSSHRHHHSRRHHRYDDDGHHHHDRRRRRDDTRSRSVDSDRHRHDAAHTARHDNGATTAPQPPPPVSCSPTTVATPPPPPVTPPPPPPVTQTTTTTACTTHAARVPLLLTTYAALQTALACVDNVAAALPLEHVRVCVLTNAERLLQAHSTTTTTTTTTTTHTRGGNSSSSMPASAWVALSTAVDVDCQYVCLAERQARAVYDAVATMLLPDALSRFAMWSQNDETLWSSDMTLRTAAVPVQPGDARQLTCAAAATTMTATTTRTTMTPQAASSWHDRGGGGGSHNNDYKDGGDGAVARVTADDIEAAKAAYTASLVAQHIRERRQRDGDGAACARVVVFTSTRREHDVLHRVLDARLRRLHETYDEHDDNGKTDAGEGASAAVTAVRPLCVVTDVTGMRARGVDEVVVLCDAQLLYDTRQLAALQRHYYSSSSSRSRHGTDAASLRPTLLVHFSLPRSVLVASGEVSDTRELADVIAARTRAVVVAAAAAIVQPPMPHAAAAAPPPVEAVLVMTEHHAHGRLGQRVRALLREHDMLDDV